MSESSDLNALKAAAFDSLMGVGDMGLGVLDRSLTYRSINDRLAQFNGSPANDHIGKTVPDMLPELAHQVVPILEQVLATGTAHLNFRISGETPSLAGRASVWLGSYIPIKNPQNDSTEGVLVIAENLTLQQELERARTDASRLVRRVLDGLFSFVGVLDLEGILIDANRPPIEAAGLQPEDVIGKLFWDCYWWSHSPALQQQLQDSFQRALRGQTSRYEVEIRIRDDGRMIIDFMLAPLLDEAGNVTHIIPSAIDVSERVQGERRLKFSEERFRRVFDSTADGLLLVNADGSVQLANRRVCQMFGYSLDQMMQIRIEDLVPPEYVGNHQALRENYQKNPEAKAMAGRRQLEALRADGSRFPVEVGLTPLTFSSGHRILATVMDVSVQKAIQQKLERALDEKTSLLNEVHHRVKNNLQVVSSLLSLQTRQVPEEVQPYFKESQDRIRAMALIHQLLYEQENYDQIDVVNYARRLLDLVRRSYISSLRGIELSIDANQEEVFIPLDIAQPFGLFMNEMITNAVKHAFPDRDKGHIQVHIEVKDIAIAISVEDDGCGLPSGVLPGNTSSLGFQLVHGLVEQMNATLEVATDHHGSRFDLTLVKPDDRKAKQ